MRFLTAGESHGPGLTVIVDDFPAGVPVSDADIDRDLARRQVGYGRGGRMRIETDRAELRGGIRFGVSTGAPVALWIENRDFANWTEIMSATGEPTSEKAFTRPRPGHADLAGYYKYGHTDLRDVLERSSARETTARVAAGALAKALLRELGIEVFSHVTVLGGLAVSPEALPDSLAALRERAESNDLRCAAPEETLAEMRRLIDETRKAGTTLGGEVEVIATGLPPGLGSYAQWDRRLDGRLAQALMSIQAVKNVSIGEGERGAHVTGAAFHDEIVPGRAPQSLTRPTNRAGGLEGGVSNGMPLIARATMKPISTMVQPLASVDLETGAAEAAHFERSDVTAVPACGVVAEAMVALVLAQAVLDKFGRDTLADIRAAQAHYRARLKPVPQG